jgi:FHS family L-fucose permease-like MFS transporter
MSEQTANSKAGTYSAPEKTGVALAVLATVFFIFGFVTAFKDPLVPHLKGIFNLSQWEADLIQFAFFSAYFVISIPSTIVVSKLGHQKSIVVGVVVMALGALLIIPAAGILSYGLFLGALWVIAAGITLIQVAANPFATLLGAPEKAPARLTLVQAFNSLGTTVAPLLGGLVILVKAKEGVQTTADRLAAAGTVKVPYLILAALLLLLAFVISRLKMPQPERNTATGGTWGDVWKHSHLVFGIIAIFVYVGAEVTIGGHLINYITAITPLTAQEATRYASMYWGGAMVGRFFGAAILGRFSGGKVLGVCGTMSLLCCATTMTTGGMIAVWAAVLVGLFNSIMFPTTFALAVNKLGPLTGKASGLLNMAICGGALIPLLQGLVIDTAGHPEAGGTFSPAQISAFHLSFIVPAACYLWIMFYGFRGSRVKNA